MPERVAQVKIAVLNPDAAAFLQGGFPVRRAVEQALTDLYIPLAVQRALFVQRQFFKDLPHRFDPFPSIQI